MKPCRWRARSLDRSRTPRGSALGVAAPHQLRAGVRQRRDRRQRVVQLVADDADHLLPGRHFLARQLARHAPQQVAAGAAGPAGGSRAATGGRSPRSPSMCDAEQARRRRVAIARAAAGGAAASSCVERQALAGCGLRRAAGARRCWRRRHGRPASASTQRDRRVLHHGVEQQLALDQVLALLAQRLAELVVRAHEIAELVVAAGRQRQAEVAVAIARHAASSARSSAQRREHHARAPAQQQRQRPRRAASAIASALPAAGSGQQASRARAQPSASAAAAASCVERRMRQRRRTAPTSGISSARRARSLRHHGLSARAMP